MVLVSYLYSSYLCIRVWFAMVLVSYSYSSYLCIRVWFTMVLVSYQCCPISVLEFDLSWSWFHTSAVLFDLSWSWFHTSAVLFDLPWSWFHTSAVLFDLSWSWFHTHICPISLLKLDLSLAPCPCLSSLCIRAWLTRVLVSHPYFCPVSALELDLSLASCLCLSYFCSRVRFTMVLVSYPCSSMSQTHLIYGRWCAYQICSLIYHSSLLSKTADNYPSKHAGSKTADNYPSKHAGSKTADNYPSKHAGSKTADNYPSKHAGSKTADNYPSKHAGSKTADNYPSKHAGSKTADNYPSKHAGSDSHPVRIGWEALATTERAGWFLHTGLLPDRIRLAKSWHNQPELNRIRAGLAPYYPGSLWKNGTKSESGKLVAGEMIPVYQLASRPDVFGQTLTRPPRSGPGRFCVKKKKKKKKKKGIEMDAESRIRHIRFGPILAAPWP